MEQLPLTFNQAVVEPEIQECFTPAYNFTKINSSNGRLAFTTGKVYWLPDNPMAMLDQGWVIRTSEIGSCNKYGINGFTIKLTDGKELRFSNVGGKMREGIMAAIDAHRADPVADTPAAQETGESPAAQVKETPGAVEVDPEDAGSNKLMGILAYLGVLVLIPLFAAKESKFVRFHVNQGLILLICSVVSWFVGTLSSGLSWLLNIAIAVFAVIGIINVVKGEAKELPLVGKVRIIG